MSISNHALMICCLRPTIGENQRRTNKEMLKALRYTHLKFLLLNIVSTAFSYEVFVSARHLKAHNLDKLPLPNPCVSLSNILAWLRLTFICMPAQMGSLRPLVSSSFIICRHILTFNFSRMTSLTRSSRFEHIIVLSIILHSRLWTFRVHVPFRL